MLRGIAEPRTALPRAESSRGTCRQEPAAARGSRACAVQSILLSSLGWPYRALAATLHRARASTALHCQQQQQWAAASNSSVLFYIIKINKEGSRSQTTMGSPLPRELWLCSGTNTVDMRVLPCMRLVFHISDCTWCTSLASSKFSSEIHALSWEHWCSRERSPRPVSPTSLLPFGRHPGCNL